MTSKRGIDLSRLLLAIAVAGFMGVSEISSADEGCQAALHKSHSGPLSEIVSWGEGIKEELLKVAKTKEDKKWARGIIKTLERAKDHLSEMEKQEHKLGHDPLIPMFEQAKKKIIEMKQAIEQSQVSSGEKAALNKVYQSSVSLVTAHYFTYLSNANYRQTERPRLNEVLKVVNAFNASTDQELRLKAYEIHKVIKKFYSEKEFRTCI
ncbi:MAG: hypothetical protein H6626_01315 [Pseudobdellovibrionaceae bacterium]|nr:hypothetical protein [Bdellovibrionales bacterium]USN47760.1 MAG: hypothetical protein H6626_01315 [Pseudobdellovibrionaceae bacterium]